MVIGVSMILCAKSSRTDWVKSRGTSIYKRPPAVRSRTASATHAFGFPTCSRTCMHVINEYVSDCGIETFSTFRQSTEAWSGASDGSKRSEEHTSELQSLR